MTSHEAPASKAPEATPARVCFELKVKPELLDEYLRRHSPVWPEMLAEIAAAGRRNYSLFLGEGGRLVGYYETDDDAAAQAYLAASAVAARWEAEMAPFFVGLEGRPDQAATALTPVFQLEDQLAALRPARASGEPAESATSRESDAS
ncbi:MAG TPA: L-rhamnose mutarotase [Microbacterium sp.]|nr:L-rhamnose mutarotase [Microbacterium sp.]